jgi:DNA polymerase-3 subunit gamma/tau
MGYIAAHDTRKALELFNKLYADGKEMGALLDELACLTRDLLILKTAPEAGITMLSGVASEAETPALVKAFSGGELVRMMELLESTMSGFTRSASRRMDAELCIMRLCQPELQLDAAGINARLTRLEEQWKSGTFVAAAPGPLAPVTQAVEEDEMPPMPDDEDAPPERTESQPMEQETSPVGFWPELVAAIRQELKPPLSGFISAGDNAPVRGSVRGNQVILHCSNVFTMQMLDKPEFLALVSRKASAILGKAVSAKVEDANERPQMNGKMEKLIDFGRQHRDIVNIKED